MNESEDIKDTPTVNVSTDNPYAYLDRSGFTSEKYKIEVRGLPKYYGINEFKKLLNDKLGLQICKVKPPSRGSGWLYVCFRNEDSRSRAISVLNGIQWKNSKLSAQIAKPAPDPFIKRKLEEEENLKDGRKHLKVQDSEESLSLVDRVKSTTIPLWKMPYPDQLEMKQKMMKNVLVKLGQQMVKQGKVSPDWINSQRKHHQGLPCELQTILSTDAIHGYRNKCEFTVGKDDENNKTVIGFRLSSYAAGSTAVGPIDELCHIPNVMKAAVKVLEEFLQDSQLEPFNPVDHTGYWKQVTIRTTNSNDLMLILGINPQDLGVDKLNDLKVKLRDFFESGKGSDVRVTSLYMQLLSRRGEKSENSENLIHINGSEYIEETLLDMKFRISPQAFFQVNTLGAETLYKAVINMAELTADTSVLDVCCGTGTIGLCLSKYCGEVLGLEMIGDAIKDAKANTVKNGVTNCEFFVGKAEDILPSVIQRSTKSNIIAIVDPPRAGLHHKALLALRKAKRLSTLIYISCDPTAATRNLVDLARPCSKQYVGEPLVPVQAIAVDMFPYTKHCELILCLKRVSKAMESLQKCN